MSESPRYSLQVPPWSGQPVRRWVRALAWLWIAIFVFIIPLAAFLIWHDGGIPRRYWLAAAAFACGEIYFTLLLLHVATKGHAPTTWIPWK